MTKLTLARRALLSIVMCSLIQVVSGQPPAATTSGEGPLAGPADTETTGASNRQKSGKEFTLDGVLLTASRVRSFMVNVTTLQIQPANDYGSMEAGMGGMEGGMAEGDMAGGEGMGGGMGGGMGMGGAMGGMSGGMGGMGGFAGGQGSGYGSGMGMEMGGMGMGGMSGPGGMAGLGGLGGMSDMRAVVAFIMDDEQIAGRTRIEILAPQGARGNYVRLENLPAAKSSKARADKKAAPLWKPAEAKLIKDTISLKIWKEDALRTLKAEEGRGEQAVASEKLLRAVLSEEYDGQLARQQFELARLQERLKRIQEEFTRRQQAKDRVIDVQLGKIILEAQGILGDNQ